MVGAYRQTYRNVIGAFGELPPGGEAFVKLIAGRAAQSWEANTGLDADGGAAGAITARLKSSQEADRADDRQGERRGGDSRRRVCSHRADGCRSTKKTAGLFSGFGGSGGWDRVDADRRSMAAGPGRSVIPRCSQLSRLTHQTTRTSIGLWAVSSVSGEAQRSDAR